MAEGNILHCYPLFLTIHVHHMEVWLYMYITWKFIDFKSENYIQMYCTRNVCITKYVYWIFTKLDHMIALWKGKNPIYFGVIMSKVKVTIIINMICYRLIIELKLSCGNDPVVKNSIYSNGDLDLWPNDSKINMVLPLPQGNHVAKIGKDLK
jgi:hypothetical protein